MCYSLEAENISKRMFFPTNFIHIAHPKELEREREKEIKESLAAVSWCAVVVSYLIPFRNLLDGRKRKRRRRRRRTRLQDRERTRQQLQYGNTQLCKHTQTNTGSRTSVVYNVIFNTLMNWWKWAEEERKRLENVGETLKSQETNIWSQLTLTGVSGDPAPWSLSKRPAFWNKTAVSHQPVSWSFNVSQDRFVSTCI